jgi:hypothetical protein
VTPFFGYWFGHHYFTKRNGVFLFVCTQKAVKDKWIFKSRMAKLLYGFKAKIQLRKLSY